MLLACVLRRNLTLQRYITSATQASLFLDAVVTGFTKEASLPLSIMNKRYHYFSLEWLHVLTNRLKRWNHFVQEIKYLKTLINSLTLI